MTIYEYFQLSDILYYKIGGTARYLLKIESNNDIEQAFAFIKEKQITKVLPVGIGANLLVTDADFDGVVLWLGKPNDTGIEITDDGLVKVYAGVLLDDVITFCFENNLKGLAWAGGLPSTVGGAVRGNVGAFGNEIKKVVERVEIVDIAKENLETDMFSNEQMEFTYRTSIVKTNQQLLITNVYFRFEKVTDEEIEAEKKIYEEKKEHRRLHNPIEYPSCGSTFKNIIDSDEKEKILATWTDIDELVQTKWHGKIAMGYIIKRLGLSGFCIGGGQISEKHCNYLINKDHASFSDIVGLIEKVKQTVYDTFGFYPEPEVQIIV